ncbi:MAG: sulfatase-like hydrolase/transferase, partial [Myxococcales bacterium]|nr:sulfatase-like hydrolase/transferase [Myxococcales bacterium]
RSLVALIPLAAAGAGLLLTTPASPRVHPFNDSAPLRLVKGALLAGRDPRASHEHSAPEVEAHLETLLEEAKIERKAGPDVPKNLLFIVLESTRWSATGLYTDLPTTPTLNGLAEHGIVPETIYVDLPHTSKALVSILCGYPGRWVQPIVESTPGGLDRPCLARILDHLGYSTGYFQSATGSYENRQQLVENMGYKFFRARESYDETGFEATNYLGLEDKVITEPLLSWIDEQKEKPFFATVLTTTTHHDYGVPKDFPTQVFRAGHESVRFNRYLNAVHYVDSFVGDVVDGLKKRGVLEDTLIVIVGDHGQGFYEHGRKGHNDVIHNEGIRVPALLSNPRLFEGPVRVPGLRRQPDLAPTALGLMGITVPEWLVGKDRLATDGHDSVTTTCWYEEKCMSEIRGGMKVVNHFAERPMEVFDLDNDPLEQEDLLAAASGDRRNELLVLAEQAKGRMRDYRDRINSSFGFSGKDWILKEAPRPEFPVYVRYGDYLEILGYDAPREVSPSSMWNATIYFRCLKPLPEGYRFFGHLETVDAQRIKLDHDPADGQLLLSQCKENMIVADALSVWIPPDFPTGELALYYGVFKKGQRLSVKKTSLEVEKDRVVLARPRIVGPHSPELEKIIQGAVLHERPVTSFPMSVSFGKGLTLIEARIDPVDVKRRSSFDIVTTWQVNRRLRGPWRLFAHLEPTAGRVVKKAVSPVRGLLPIDAWRADTWVQDRTQIFLSHKWAWPLHRPVNVWIGVFKGDERLVVTDSKNAVINDNRVLAGSLTVVDD